MGFAHILGHTKFIMCALGEAVVLHIRANHKKASIKIPTTTTTTTPAILVHKHSQHYIYIYIYH